jgi:hypothetical protein
MPEDLDQIQQALRAIRGAVMEIRNGRLPGGAVDERLDTIVHAVRSIERDVGELAAELRRATRTARGDEGR